MIFEFLLGVLIAQLPRDARLALPLVILSVVAFAHSPLSLFRTQGAIDASVSAWRAFFWGVPAALAVYGCLCGERAFTHRALVPLVMLGDASYSIYLFHRLADFAPAPWPLKFMAGVSLGVAVHWLIERPILRLKPRISERNLGAAPVPAE